MNGGIVLAVQVASAAGAPMVSVDKVLAVPGRGLRGDRYFAQTRGNRAAAVTLIEWEALEALHNDYGADLAVSATRRNILTRGVSLNPLIGHSFQIGDVHLYGTGLCQPCRHIARSEPRILRGLVGRGGLRAEIVTEGEIKVGDSVTKRSDSVAQQLQPAVNS